LFRAGKLIRRDIFDKMDNKPAKYKIEQKLGLNGKAEEWIWVFDEEDGILRCSS
jgi:hypothetical protein